MRTAMMAMTTKSSMSVKPARRRIRSALRGIRTDTPRGLGRSRTSECLSAASMARPLLRHLTLGVLGRLHAPGQVRGRPLAPEVREEECRLLADHVIVQGDDVDAGLAKRPQDRLHFGGGHDEVAVHG